MARESGNTVDGTCSTFEGSNRRAYALLVLGVLLAALAVAAAGPTAAEGGAAPQSDDEGPNATFFYQGERVEGFQAVGEIQRTPDGGLIAFKTSGGEPPETTVVRFDDTGEVVGREVVTGLLDSIARVDEDAYVAAGTRGEDVLVARIGMDGAVEWTRTYGGEEVDIATDVASAPDGGAYVLASTNSFGAETSDLWVLRLAGDGSVAWDRRVEHETWTAFPKGERLADGSLVATIRTKRSMDKEVDGDQNISVVRLTPDGEETWRTLVTGPGPPADKDEVFDVVPAHGDGVLMVGTSNSGHDRWHQDFWAAQVGPDGDLRWQRQYDSETSDVAASVVRTSDGYVLAGGSKTDDGSSAGMVVAIGPDGSEWFRTTSGHRENLDSRFHAMGWSDDGRLLIGGLTMNMDERRSQPWILHLRGEASQLEPGPSTWETQHPSTAGPDDGGDGTDAADSAGEDDGGTTNPTETATLSGDVEPGSADLVLYGGAAVSTSALFLPYGLRRFRRR